MLKRIATNLLSNYLLTIVSMVLGFILGPLMEENLRRSLVLSRGDPVIFFQRPISAILLGLSAMVVLLIVLPSFRKTREQAFQE